jgi:cytidyltransferase-like protein
MRAQHSSKKVCEDMMNHVLLISIVPTLIAALLQFALPAGAAPLTRRSIQDANRIVILPGTFDPITTGHMALAQLAVDKGGADAVILMAQENPKKHPIPRADRLALIAEAADSAEKIYYPKQGTEFYDDFRDKSFFGLSREIKRLNPKATIIVLLGSDNAASLFSTTAFGFSLLPNEWLIVPRKGSENQAVSLLLKFWKHSYVNGDLPNVSSTKVKKQLEVYFASNDASGLAQAGIVGIEPEVAQKIVNRELYGSNLAPFCANLFAAQ